LVLNEDRELLQIIASKPPQMLYRPLWKKITRFSTDRQYLWPL
jgi:hypothetical protein